jgi:glutamine synthetase
MDTGSQNSSGDRARIGGIAEEHGLHTVRVGAVDIDGVWRGKQVGMAEFLETVWRDGMHLCNAVLGVTVADDIVPGLGYVWDRGLPDVHIVPDLATFARVPWADGTASVICDFAEADGSSTVYSPRQVLREVLGKVGKRGLEPRIGYELEFYLFRESCESAREKGFADLTPLFPDLHTYRLSQLGRLEPVLGDIVRQMAAIGIPVEAATIEYSPSQFELNLRYTGALSAADQAVRFKAGVREIAETHGLVATFMPKYDTALGGSSGHIHQSLWDTQGRNVFAGLDGNLSDIARHYLAGLLATMTDCSALFGPTVNSYKRTTPMSFAPTTATWGVDNRTTGLRALTGSRRLPGSSIAAPARTPTAISPSPPAWRAGCTGSNMSSSHRRRWLATPTSYRTTRASSCPPRSMKPSPGSRRASWPASCWASRSSSTSSPSNGWRSPPPGRR